MIKRRYVCFIDIKIYVIFSYLIGGSSLGEEDMKPFGSQVCLLPYSSLQNLEKYGHLYSYDQKPSMRRVSVEVNMG